MQTLSTILLLAATLTPPRAVWTGPSVTLLGGPSKDGKWLSYVERGDLALRELATGRTVLVTRRPAASKEFAYFSTISPDSRRIAYAWFNELGFYELRVVDLAGGEPRTVFRNEEAGFVQPCAWSPDGSQILTLLFRKDNISQIVMQPAAGGLPKVLKSLNWVYPKKMDLSPDGRWIVYDSFAAEGAGERTIYLLAVDGTKERRLISEPGEHLFPAWTPDGQSIVYSSGVDVRVLNVAHGQSRSIANNLGRVVPLGITSDGTYYYGLRTGGTDVFASEVGGSQPRPVSIRFPGRNSHPAWSPDGQWLAFLSRRGTETFGEETRVLVLRAAKGDEEREVAPKLARMDSPHWTSDGKAILVHGTDRLGREGAYRVDIETAAASRVPQSPDTCTSAAKAFLCGTELRVGAERYETTLAEPIELAWAPQGGAILVGDGVRLVRIPLDHSPVQKIDAPPGVSIHPNGRTIAYTAGSTSSEVWSLKLP
ncbi:MAG: hypothetical protein ABJF23_27670 [Bryobacteraceae bacterium]